MASELETDLNRLIAKCECAVRRGDVPHLEILHEVQRKLVTARDARHSAQTEAKLRTTKEFYDRHVPADERNTTFGALTEQFEAVAADLEAAESDNASEAVGATSE